LRNRKVQEIKVGSKFKYFNLKQIGGLILCGVGGYLVYLAVEGFKEIAQAKDFAHRFTNFFHHNPTWNPLIKFFGGTAQEKISESELPATLALAGGVALLIIGTAIIIFFRTRNKDLKN